MKPTTFPAQQADTLDHPEVMASIRDLEKSFGDRDVLKGVNLDLYKCIPGLKKFSKKYSKYSHG